MKQKKKGKKRTGTRQDRQKRNIGGATHRSQPSLGAKTLVDRGLIVGKTLDFGCGFGFDAQWYGWDSYDPYYQPKEPQAQYDTIVCINVLNAISRVWREYAIRHMQKLLKDEGCAYISVARNIPKEGKVCDFKRFQYHVVLTLPSVYQSHRLEIYALGKTAQWEDLTREQN